jgi:hypothetical protein
MQSGKPHPEASAWLRNYNNLAGRPAGNIGEGRKKLMDERQQDLWHFGCGSVQTTYSLDFGRQASFFMSTDESQYFSLYVQPLKKVSLFM